MKDAASTAQREQNQRQGLIVGTLTLPFRLLGVLIGSLLFSIVVECVGMHLFWKDQGWRHSQQMLQYELGHLSSHFTRSVVVQEPGRTAHQLVDTGYEWVFVRSGLLERMSQTAERARAPITRLSGGEQQMVVIGRALMANPKLMMIDEPSLGLAPMMVDEVFGVLRSLKEDGLTLLIVEQNTRVALDLADFGYVMEDGRIVLEGNAADLRANEDIREFYLGLNLEGVRKSYRNIKHYRRRKRWLG